ncbi:unnamed protein product [Caenorhabditis nigoni]
MLKLLVSLVLLSTVSADGTTCRTGNVVNRRVNGDAYYFPATWNETLPAPKLAKEQSCSWTITIPSGYYVKVIIDGKTTDEDSRFQMIDSVGHFIQTTHEKKNPYFFPPTKLTLAVSNYAEATFGFRIEWAQLPAGPFKIHGIGEVANLVNATNSIYNEFYGSTEGISLLVFPEDRRNYYSLRSTLVFESASTGLGNYIDNLYEMYRTGNQFLSQSTGIVLVNVEDSGKTDLLLVQSEQYTKNFTYVELVTVANSTYNATVNSHHELSVLVSATHINQTMINVEIGDTDIVTQYVGTPTPFWFDKNYTGAELKAALPIFYPDYGIIQWVLHSGRAVFTFQA